MNWCKRFIVKKYFRTIYVSFIIGMFFLFFSSLSIMHTAAAKNILNLNEEMNRQVFSQIRYNINQTNESIRRVCKSIYFNPATITMMNTDMKDEDIYSWILSLDYLTKPFLISTPSIHSVSVYNYKMDRWFSTYPNLNFQDKYIDEILGSTDIPLILTPIFREIEDASVPSGKKQVFTYMMYETLDERSKPEGAVMINISVDWVLENINDLNKVSSEDNSKVVVINSKGEFIGSFIKDEEAKKSILDSAIEQIIPTLEKGTIYGYTTQKLNKEKVCISYNYIDAVDWIVLKVQPYKEMFKYINYQKNVLLILVPSFVAFILIEVYYISKRIYDPIGKLIDKLNFTKGVNEKDEITFLNETYDRIIEEKKEISARESFMSMTLKNYYLKQLLINSTDISERDIVLAREVHPDLLEEGGTWIVGVCKIDYFKTFKEKYNKKDQELYYYVIENILGEVVGTNYVNKAINMFPDEMVIIMHVKEKDEEEKQLLEQLFFKALNIIKANFGISFTIAISDEIYSIRDMTKAYNQAINNSCYRYILGHEAFITNNKVIKNNQNLDYEFPIVYIKNLYEPIKNHDEVLIKENLNKILYYFSGLNYKYMGHFMVLLMNHLMTLLMEIHKEDNLQINYNELYDDYTQLETIEEITEELLRVIHLFSPGIEPRDKKNDLITETVKKMIDENLVDSELCLQQLADGLNMSSQYVGRIFKNNMGISVSNYINDLRLEKAKELIIHSKLSVNQIMERVGIENESRFYRLFKKKYGSTPKEYFIKKINEES